jgi:hypothetical protein
LLGVAPGRLRLYKRGLSILRHEDASWRGLAILDALADGR